jgi:hypothetical protein
MKRALLHLLFVVLALGFSAPGHAWGTKGHRVIAALAAERLTSAAQAAVNELLQGEDLATAATWADEMRSSRDNPEFWSRYAANWHYVNIDKGSDYQGSAKNPRGDALVALETFTAILLDEPLPAGPVLEGLEFYFGELDAQPAAVKRFALKFLLHILGDLQQPLHLAYAEDRGGNEAGLTWFGERSNLHALWDTLLVERRNFSVSEYTRRLGTRIEHTPASDIRGLERADPRVWMDESRRLLDRIYTRQAGSTELGADYAAEFVPTVEAQLVKGGVRTAMFLNGIFGGWPAGLWRNSPTAGESLPD